MYTKMSQRYQYVDTLSNVHTLSKILFEDIKSYYATNLKKNSFSDVW